MQHRRIIKQGPVVLATREDGAMDPSSPSSQGLFLADTRFLSRFQIYINELTPVLLGSSEEILFESSFLHTNPDLTNIPSRALGILQHNKLSHDHVEIEVIVVNWSLKSVQLSLSIELGSDFFDSFEARGVKRLKRGEVCPPEVDGACVKLQYKGLDNVTRTTEISADPGFERFEGNRMYFPVELRSGTRKAHRLRIQLIEDVPPEQTDNPGPRRGAKSKPAWFDRSTRFATGNEQVDSIIERGIADLEVLMLQFPESWVPAAGLPRFAVPFGRDCVITGLETLSWNCDLSRDVLRFLAKRQGKSVNPWNYEQPGKIMHEMHTGELARLKEVPFGLFYGSVDSTPLFLVLGAEYLRWTGDLSLFHALKDNFAAAWKWIEEYGDIDGSGYVQYQAHTSPAMSTAALSVGLFNQGWKDSATAVMYASGEMVTDHPIALAEVQADLYRALDLWAGIYETMPASEGVFGQADRLRKKAEKLREQFNREFWMPDKNYYAMALDGHHRHVDSITSNPAECLWARLISDEHVDDLVKVVMSTPMLTSWGIRTMATTEPAFNPFSYHDGSIWPFENALIASGLKKYGFTSETQQIFDALVDASLYFEYQRWPEVYCGVSRAVGGVLARQPDASRPQAWSAGAIFLFLQTILGVAPRPFSRHVDLTPALPECISEISVDNMRILDTTLSLRVLRQGGSILMEIKDNPGELDIVIHPASRVPQNVRAPLPARSS